MWSAALYAVSEQIREHPPLSFHAEAKAIDLGPMLSGQAAVQHRCKLAGFWQKANKQGHGTR